MQPAAQPTPSRPYMPDYGISGPSSGTGLLPWSWAHERLVAAHDYWVATIHPDGRPNVTPVWGVWDGQTLWISCGPRSRKARNLERDGRVTATTDDANEPVVLEGTARRIRDRDANVEFAELLNAKYGTGYGVEFLLANASFRVAPQRAFGLTQEDFSGSPTRWTF